MKINSNIVLIFVGILLASILIIENMVSPVQAYVLIWIKNTYILAAASICTGILIGYGIRGQMNAKDESGESDEYDF